MVDAGLASIEVVRGLRFDAFLPNKGYAANPVPWAADDKMVILDEARDSVARKHKGSRTA
jgi:hypothetical protein